MNEVLPLYLPLSALCLVVSWLLFKVVDLVVCKLLNLGGIISNTTSANKSTQGSINKEQSRSLTWFFFLVIFFWVSIITFVVVRHYYEW